MATIGEQMTASTLTWFPNGIKVNRIIDDETSEPFATAFQYEDIAALAAATVPVIVTRVYCRYYTAANKIGGAWYKRVNAEPSHNLKVQDASGAWFEHDETDIWVEQAGAIGDGTTNDATAIQSCIALAAARGGGKVRLRAADYAISSTLTVTANNVFIEGMGQSDYHSAQANWSTNAATRIKWTGSSGGTIVSFESPVADDKKIGGGMSRLMLDGNDFLANRGLEVKTWNRADFYAVTVHACAVECFWTGISSNAIVNDKGVQCVTFRECVASARGTSGTYLTSTSVGFRLTGKNSDNANTNFCLLTHCRAVMSKGVPYQLENCDNNTLIQCSGGAQRDATVPALVFGSAEYDSIESVGGARYNSAIFCQLQTLCASGQSGGNSSAANMVLLSNANGVTVPTFQTPAGGSDQSTCTVLDCDGTLTLGSTQVLGAQKTGWDIPVGAQKRTWIDPASLTVTELAKRFYALLADLQEHGVIDASTGAAIPDSLTLAAGYEDVVAISFIDNTMTIRDTATPANDYQGTATGKLTVTGSLTSGVNGATFDASNYATFATSLFNWSNATGTVMVEYDDPAFTTGANATIFQIDDGTANERHIFRSITTTADKPRAVMYDGGVLQLDSSPAGWPTYVNGTVARVVLAFELNNTRISHSGTGATDTGCTMPTVTTVRLGVGIAAAEPLNGRIRRVLILPARLVNDDANALSVV